MRALAAVCLLAGGWVPGARAAEKPESYAVVVSAATAADAEWKGVAEALAARHGGAPVIVWTGKVREATAELAKRMPRHTAFIERPQAIDRAWIAELHRLTRRLDDDPYGDTIWGVITGRDAADARRLAGAHPPLVFRRAMGLTGLNEGLFDDLFIVSDGQRGAWLHKTPTGGVARGTFGDGDAIGRFAEVYNAMKPDLVVGSGHATQRNLEMSWSRGNILTRDGHFFGIDRTGNRFTMDDSPNPKVFLGVGNCLIGDIGGRRDTMALTWLGSAGAVQMLGYTVNTWFGRGGWGALELLQSRPGRLTVAEAHFLNNQRILRDLIRIHPELATVDFPINLEGTSLDLRGIGTVLQMRGLKPEKNTLGLLHDRDVVVLYGDPAWEARFDPARDPAPVRNTLSPRDGGWDWTVTPVETTENTAPLGVLLPERVPNPRVAGGAELDVLAADNFVMVMNPPATNATGFRIEIRPGG